MARDFFYYQRNSYAGGQNDSDEADQLKEDQCAYIGNAITDSVGLLKKRLGNIYLGNVIEDTTPITGLFSYIKDVGTSYELRINGTDLEYQNSGTWTSLSSAFTSQLDTHFTQANNKVYIHNGTDNTYSYDGSTVVDMGGAYPRAKYSAWWKNYLFITGNSYVGSTQYKSRIWFSNLGDPDTITTATDYFDVGKSDGQEIMGIHPLGQFLVIFKRKSIYIIDGSNPDAWKLSASVNNVVNIANGIGCVSAKSIVQVGNDLWFASDDGIRSINRNEEGSVPLMGQVSANINKTYDDINEAYFDKITGTFFNNKVYYAIPTGTSMTNNVVMVANTKTSTDNPLNPYPWFTYTGWTPYVFNTHLVNNQAELHWGDSLSPNVFVGEVGYTDQVGEIDFDIKGRMIDGGESEMHKIFRFMKYGVRGSGDYDLDIYTSTNGATYTYRDFVNLLQGSEWDVATWGNDKWVFVEEIKDKIAFKIGSPHLQIRFRNTGNNEPITLYPYTVAIKKRKIK